MRLNRREQRAALVAVILLSVGVLYGFILKPTLTRTETLRRVIGDKRQQLQELRARGERYVALSQGYRDLQQQILLIDPNQGLFLMLDPGGSLYGNTGGNHPRRHELQTTRALHRGH